jgi:hypothetical protein
LDSPTPHAEKTAIFALLLAWLCANGVLLDAAQVLAWAKMFAGYSSSMSVAAALDATFDPEKPCNLCVGISTARDTAKQQLPQAVERAAEKLLLALHRPEPIVLTHDAGDWPATLASVAPSRTESVPVPPPRA